MEETRSNLIHVVITGPECIGKSTLAKALGRHYRCPVVPEVARLFLLQQNGAYEESDLLRIAQLQLDTQKSLVSSDNDLVISDTGLLVIKVWSRVKYGRVDSRILGLMDREKVDLYLLPHFDIPYEEDPLRENPTDREKLYEIYLTELTSLGLPFLEIQGSPNEQVAQASKFIDTLILNRT